MKLTLQGFLMFLRRLRLKRALARHSANPGLRESVGLASAYLSLDSPRKALEVASAARRSYPDDPALRAKYDEARTAQARILLGQATRALQAESTVDSYARVIDLQRALGDFGEAARYATEACARYPEHWAVHFALGKLCYYRSLATGSADDRSEARRHLSDARVLNPDHYNTLILLGVTLARMDDFAESAKVAAEILEKFPDDPRAMQLSAYVERARRAQRAAAARSATAAEQPVGVQEDRETSRFLRDCLGAVPGTVGLFLMDPNGNPVDSLTTPNDAFDFQGRIEAVRALVHACRFDSRRIGIGTLKSCMVSGTGWHVSVHPHGQGDLVAFFAGTASPEDAERELRGMVEESMAAYTHA